MPSPRTSGARARASIFAALGDETRLSLVRKLSGGRPRSISTLSEGSRLTRQAITKHLRVLADAGIVHAARSGRECLFEFDPRPLEEARTYLGVISAQWDEALGRLKSLVEQ